MANKHVLNPCTNSGGSDGLFNEDAVFVTICVGKVWKQECAVCGNMATVNKKTKVFRKHSKDPK